jgi:hypothetical protein
MKSWISWTDLGWFLLEGEESDTAVSRVGDGRGSKELCAAQSLRFIRGDVSCLRSLRKVVFESGQTEEMATEQSVIK